MQRLKLLLIGFAALCVDFGMAQGEKHVNCYIGTWANYRPDFGAFKPEHIDPFLCSIISYSFFGINGEGRVTHLDTWLDIDLGYIANIIALKNQNPKLKVLMVVGGWNEGSARYSQMAASPAKRKNFIDSALKIIKQFGFDGLDLDWEYPTRRDGATPQDRDNFVTLLKEVYQVFKPSNLLFGIAVGASGELAKIAYDIPGIAANVDFVNLMTYDFHTAGEGFTGSNAPLAGPGPNNVKASVQYWLDHGTPAEKLILGLPFYGRSYRLANPAQHGLGAPANGPGTAGTYTRESGFLGYNEICLDIGKYNREWSDEEESAYLYNDREFVSYDDEESIAKKVAYGLSKNLGGFMIWSIETDDFHGRCGTKNPLLKAINNALGKPQDMSPSNNELPKIASSSVQTLPSETFNSPKLEQTGDCSVDGAFANKDDCSAFIECVHGNRYDKVCPSGLHFDSSSKTCNWPEDANCK